MIKYTNPLGDLEPFDQNFAMAQDTAISRHILAGNKSGGIPPHSPMYEVWLDLAVFLTGNKSGGIPPHSQMYEVWLDLAIFLTGNKSGGIPPHSQISGDFRPYPRIWLINSISLQVRGNNFGGIPPHSRMFEVWLDLAIFLTGNNFGGIPPHSRMFEVWLDLAIFLTGNNFGGIPPHSRMFEVWLDLAILLTGNKSGGIPPHSQMYENMVAFRHPIASPYRPIWIKLFFLQGVVDACLTHTLCSSSQRALPEQPIETQAMPDIYFNPVSEQWHLLIQGLRPTHRELAYHFMTPIESEGAIQNTGAKKAAPWSNYMTLHIPKSHML
ncbi:hypothetical protein FPV67DRAFT_1444206 [Lyophyllum atratum]|nr:hypothetical protein FPV67DRAFT_1444206 [Lyophyllum atratum]